MTSLITTTFAITAAFICLPLIALEWHRNRHYSPCVCQNEWLPGRHSRHICDFNITPDHATNGEWA